MAANSGDAGSPSQAAEHAALRRVATLVAEGAPAAHVFEVVAEQVAGILAIPLVSIARYGPDGTATAAAGHGTVFPVGTCWTLDGPSVLAEVRASGRPARSDDHIGMPGASAAGIRSSVAVPVVVAGRLWGTIVALSVDAAPLPPETESRLTGFSELLALAIANADARTEGKRLADEQAALRRVATMVARGCAPEEIFLTVAEEVAQLFGAEAAALQRYEPEGDATVVGTWGKLREAFQVGSRLPLEGDSVIALVHRTGRPVRVDSYERASGLVVSGARGVGLRSGVGGPVVVNGRLWGVVGVATSREEPMPPDAEARIGEFSALVGLAIANVQAHADLEASRARVVAASDETRRQIMRDVHDGAQQRLVQTVLTLKLARQALERGDADLEELVDAALYHAEEATVALRELVHGILPPVLTRGGLEAAVDSLVTRMPIPVEVDVDVGRFPPRIEATAYFVVAEALTNVVKHARARRATVGAQLRRGRLEVEVRDDGIGGAHPHGTGLVGLTDRLDVLRGTLRVESRPEGGTVVAASIPVS